MEHHIVQKDPGPIARFNAYSDQERKELEGSIREKLFVTHKQLSPQEEEFYELNREVFPSSEDNPRTEDFIK